MGSKPSWTCLAFLPWPHPPPPPLHPFPTPIPLQPPRTPERVSPVPAVSTFLPQPVHYGADFYFSGPTTSFSVLPIAHANIYLLPLFNFIENPEEKANKCRQSTFHFSAFWHQHSHHFRVYGNNRIEKQRHFMKNKCIYMESRKMVQMYLFAGQE